MDFSPDSLSLLRLPVLSILCVPSASQLDLSYNTIGGHYGVGCNPDFDGELQQIFTADPDGAQDIAGALRVNGGLTELNIAHNSITDDGITAICNAVQSYKESKLAKLNVADNNISPIGATAVAAIVAVTGSLTLVRAP